MTTASPSPESHAAAAIPQRSRPRSGNARGFTLVELLLAMTAGLFVASATVLLAKNATQFFQHEARISGAQLSSTLGLSRIAGDLQRASFMSTPNIQKDINRCGDAVGLPNSMKDLAGIQIIRGGSVANGGLEQSTANGFNPDSIVIAGSFSTTEQFPVQYYDGATQTVYLQIDNGAMARTRVAAAQGGPTVAEIFAKGRMLRIVDSTGKALWGRIDVTTESPGEVKVQLDPTPTLQQKLNNNACGWEGLGVGMLANPVSRIRYEIMSLRNDPTYGTLVEPISPEVTGDGVNGGTGGRTELVRHEIDLNDAIVAGTTEIVAEYAVDLKFGITVASLGNAPVLTRFPITSPETDAVYDFTGPVSAGPPSAPERVRSVQVRLSTRSRAPDRRGDLTAGPDGRRLRFNLDTDPNNVLPDPKFARMRTVYADIALPNQAGVTW